MIWQFRNKAQQKMKIFIDQAVYDQRNIGNVSLLQTTVNRLFEMWPNSTVQVLTEAPYSLKLILSESNPSQCFPFS